MKKILDTKEFADMVRESGSLIPALGLMANIYKRQIPNGATLENSAESCYISGAFCTLQLFRNLGLLNRKGDALAADFCTEVFNLVESDERQTP